MMQFRGRLLYTAIHHNAAAAAVGGSAVAGAGVCRTQHGVGKRGRLSLHPRDGNDTPIVLL